MDSLKWQWPQSMSMQVGFPVWLLVQTLLFSSSHPAMRFHLSSSSFSPLTCRTDLAFLQVLLGRSPLTAASAGTLASFAMSMLLAGRQHQQCHNCSSLHINLLYVIWYLFWVTYHGFMWDINSLTATGANTHHFFLSFQKKSPPILDPSAHEG